MIITSGAFLTIAVIATTSIVLGFAGLIFEHFVKEDSEREEG